MATLVTLVAATAQAPDAVGQDPSSATLRAIAQAFTASSAEKLRHHLPSEGQVHLSLPGICCGFKGAEQAFHKFRDFFEQNRTQRFLLHQDSIETSDSNVFANARWEYTRRDQGESVQKLDVELTLAKEDGRWVLKRIRAEPA